MTKKALIDQIRKELGYTYDDTKKYVELFFCILTKYLKEGNRVEIRGLGVFTPTIFKRNGKHFVRVNFKTSKVIMKALNGEV